MRPHVAYLVDSIGVPFRGILENDTSVQGLSSPRGGLTGDSTEYPLPPAGLSKGSQ